MHLVHSFLKRKCGRLREFGRGHIIFDSLKMINMHHYDEQATQEQSKDCAAREKSQQQCGGIAGTRSSRAWTRASGAAASCTRAPPPTRWPPQPSCRTSTPHRRGLLCCRIHPYHARAFAMAVLHCFISVQLRLPTDGAKTLGATCMKLAQHKRSQHSIASHPVMLYFPLHLSYLHTSHTVSATPLTSWTVQALEQFLAARRAWVGARLAAADAAGRLSADGAARVLSEVAAQLQARTLSGDSSVRDPIARLPVSVAACAQSDHTPGCAGSTQPEALRCGFCVDV